MLNGQNRGEARTRGARPPLSQTGFALAGALAFCLCVCFGAVSLIAASNTTAASASAVEEDLFTALKNAPNETTARAIERQIWATWIDAAPAPELKTRLEAAMTLRSQYDFAGAKDLLDAITREAPGYAEGWNQRAFVLFLQGNYEDSLADIDKVLELEPRHFGALSGKAMIFMAQGRAKLAQDTLRRAVSIHPYLKERFLLIKPKGQEL